MLGHRYPKVRKVVAEQFYSASLIVEDIIPPQSMEAVLSLLSETAWDGVRTAAKSARDQLFPLLGVPKPAEGVRALIDPLHASGSTRRENAHA